MNIITNNINYGTFKSQTRNAPQATYKVRTNKSDIPKVHSKKNDEEKGLLKNIALYLSLAASTTLSLKANIESWFLENKVEDLQNALANEGTRIEKLEADSLNKLIETIQTVSPSTVRVESDNSTGSGVIFFDKNHKAYIITNAHVTGEKTYNKNKDDDDFKFTIKLYSNGDYSIPVEFEATFLKAPGEGDNKAESKKHDLAILEIPDNIKLPEIVTGVQFRDLASSPVKQGEILATFGNPFSLKDSTNINFVSSTNRKISRYKDNKYIELSGSINPGNSGGATVDKEGKLIGINQLLITGKNWGDGNGLGQIIRVDTVLDYIKSLDIPLN